ncbi:MAG: HAMP domain-containing protein [Alphaproteobacteria bacterium]|nr:HAMP domain-containing protein [Alphaproteobacteria bacterium]
MASPPPADPRAPVRATAGVRVPTIRLKILLAFLLMAGITGVFGLSAVRSISESGELVVESFDQSLMSVNHARAAQAGFVSLQARVAAAAQGRRATTIASELDALGEGILEDLAIVADRVLSDTARRAALDAVESVRAWLVLGRRAGSEGAGSAALEALGAQAAERFELLVNFVASDAFRGRQHALAMIAEQRRRVVGAVILAVSLSAAIAFLLTRRILRRVAAASQVAATIAAGELDVAIPVMGGDELGRLLGSMTIMRDNIRAMVERERRLRRSAQVQLLDAIEGSREGVVLVDTDGTILLANSQAHAFLPGLEDQFGRGVHYDALLEAAVSLRRFRWETPDEAAALRARLTAGDTGTDEAQLDDGRWLRLSRSATREGGFVAIWSEITVLKEREGVLRDAAARAQAANRAKTEFLANMSHELRTPLNAVIGFSEMMEAEMLGPIGRPKYKEFAGDILRSGRHLLAIINDILSLAKSEAGRLVLDVAPVDLPEIIAASGRMMAEAGRSAGVTLSIDATSDLPTIEADPVKVKQVLLNLLSNAIKFTPAGGRVDLTARATGSGVAIAVRDTGIGMAPEEIPIALAPFGQVDSRLARKYEGTGLGLPLTKAFVELHGGTLAIDSARGAGTTVTVTFPFAAAMRDAA